MSFQRGRSGNPRGRPKGAYGGRIQALGVLDRMMAKSGNKKKLAAALQKEFDEGGLKFFKSVVMPLLPKEAKVAVENDGIVEWKSLVQAFLRTGPLAEGMRVEIPRQTLDSSA